MTFDLPEHVTATRRDGRREVLLHRSMAVIGPEKIEIKASRATTWLPILALLICAAAGWWLVASAGDGPLWLMVIVLLALLFVVPSAIGALVSAVAGADVVVDARKGSITWQQGYLGMGIGTRELVPFAKIDHLEVTVEGEDPDRWRGEQDSLRQFALELVKVSGKRLTIAQVPVFAGAQADGMDRTLAVAHAVANLTGTTVRLPEGWELVEIDTSTGEPVAPKRPETAPTKRKRKK